MLWRTQPTQSTQNVPTSPTVGDMVIDPATYTVTRDGTPLSLRPLLYLPSATIR
ncbi:MAG: response regulator transcription factor [Ardenticatenales bacterium]|nr:response regulator transcription factor [Ardenticatenales bacterium]